MSDSTTNEVVEEVDVVAPGQETDPVAALTADLQRLQAEYANYKKRVERDRSVAHDFAIGAVLTDLLPVLDDLDRAAEHGELTGGFKSVADQIINSTTRVGLEKYGVAGDAFDPMIHEALMHSTSPDVTETSVTQVLQPGFKFKDRVIRPARVAVTDPEN